MIAATKPNYNDMFYNNGPYLRISKEHPGMPAPEVIKEYRRYLRSMSLIDPTPMNDVVGWLARRMTGEHTLDAIVVVYGDRGTGKSYVCGYLGERLDKRLCLLSSEPEKSYFSIDNVRSVDKSGTLAMLSPNKLKERPNQVFVLDDASITTNARKFQSPENQYLNYILTTARIYRHCIILNTISSNLIDSVARSFADVGILVEGLIPGTTINRCRIYRMSQNNHMGFGKASRESIGKYFQITLNGERNRMRTWYTNKPSDPWCKAYDALRKENTDKLGNGVEAWVNEDVAASPIISVEKRGQSRAAKRKQMITKYYQPVIDKFSSAENGKRKLTISEIAREVGISREWVSVMLQERKQRQMAGSE